MKKIVVLGGGTGLSVLLRGLKQFPLDITAIVSVADDGSSSGKLREEFDIFAVGDIRNVLVSLSEVEPLIEELLQYRFTTDSNLNNHPVGNLLLAALYNITGNLTESLTSLSKIFNIKGRILPFTEDNPILIAHTKDGSIIEGESKITKAGQEIDYIEYKNKVSPTKEVLNALKEADLIILGIGSLYTSIIPNLLSEEVKERYKQMFIGVFYQRFILGLWVLAEGIIYPNFDRLKHCVKKTDIPKKFDYFYVTSDYGITNPQVFLLCRNKVYKWKTSCMDIRRILQ